MTRWLLFGISFLAVVLGLGGWQAAERDLSTRTRGLTLATREESVPERLPLAGINIALTQVADPQAELQKITDLGFTWVRQPFLWSEIEPEQGVYQWDAYDRLVAAVAQVDGLALVAVLDGSPAWARHENAPDHPFAPPNSPADFGVFAQAVATRYGETIDYYQIWDEPNIEEHWGELNPRPALYVAMLDAAYDAIHGADAEASVIAAALAPNTETGPDNINDPDYLRAIYALGGGNSFDAAAGKPYGFNLPPDDRTVNVNTLNFSRLILLREVMVANGDGDKPLWGSNFGWNYLPDDWAGEPSIWGSVTAEQQVAYTRQAYHRAATEWAWIGGLILQHWQPDYPADHPIQGFAVAPEATTWAEVVPQFVGMPPGRFPAVNPYATYTGDWEFGDLGADGNPDNPPNTITIPFEGNEFAIRVRRGDYLAYLLVTIDGQPANLLPRHRNGDAFIALTDPERQPSVDLIRVAGGLSDGTHTAVITHRPEQGQDYWSIAGFAVAQAPAINTLPRTIAQAVLLIGLIMTLITGVRLPWHSIRLPSSATLRNLGDLGLGLFFSAIVMGGSLLTWHETLTVVLKRDLPTVLATLATSTILFFAPSTWIALIGLALTGIVIFARPWIGVLLVVFWSAFFSTNLEPFFRAFALVEAMLYLTLAATLARLLYDAAQVRQFFNLWRLRLHPLDVGVLGLFAAGCISLNWAEIFPEAVRELRVVILQPALLYLLIRLNRPSRRDLAFMVETLLLVGFLIAAAGLFNYTRGEVIIAEGGTKRLISVYGSPNGVGLMLGRILPFALAYVLLPVSPWRKVYAAISGLTMLIAVLLSQSVGAIILGLPAALIVILIGWRGQRAVPVLAGLGAAGAVALLPITQLVPRLRQITDYENSTTLFRVSLWRSSIQLLQDYPLTGVGLDQFLYAYRSRYILPEAWRDPDLSHPHNLVLDYWVRLGVLGLALLVWFQWFFWQQAMVVYRQVRDRDPLSFALVLGAMGAMADFLAHGLVDMAYFNINLSHVFMLLVALVVQLAYNQANIRD